MRPNAMVGEGHNPTLEGKEKAGTKNATYNGHRRQTTYGLPLRPNPYRYLGHHRPPNNTTTNRNYITKIHKTEEAALPLLLSTPTNHRTATTRAVCNCLACHKTSDIDFHPLDNHSPRPNWRRPRPSPRAVWTPTRPPITRRDRL